MDVTYWDDVYHRCGSSGGSWHQNSLAQSLALIESTALGSEARILDAGGGASTLVDDLLRRGYTQLTVADLSGEALAQSRQRLGEAARKITWREGDIAELASTAVPYDLWHDRALFHFMVDAHQRNRYRQAMMAALRPGGHLIVATFALDGPAQCSGLGVARYDANSLYAEFAADFDLIKCVTESHLTPHGKRQPFVYCHCQRRWKE